MLRRKSLIDVDSLELEDIELILANADTFLEISGRDVKKVPVLRGRTIANLFFEPSTRTKTSFEIAAKRLSADIINFSSSTSSVVKGESVIDTLKTILSMKVDMIVMRHGDSGAVKMVDDSIGVPVVNAGDGKNQHPTQALLDLYTIKKVFGEFKGLKIAIVGDFINSRVAGSDINLFKKMGMDVTIVSPTMLLPEDFSNMNVKHCIDDVIEESDIIYVLRMQFERQERKFYPSVMEYNRFLSLDIKRLSMMKKGSIVMHPGPVNRGIEISDEVMETGGELGEKMFIDRQVTYGVAVRMALIYLILG